MIDKEKTNDFRTRDQSSWRACALHLGMTFMSDGLKKLAGDYMKTILEKLTEKRIMAVLLGAGLTALIQSLSLIHI